MLESKGGERFGGGVSPGGFEFGIVGFQWGEPIPRSMTFFLDNTVMITDQYGRHIRRAISPDGVEVRFADSAPDASREGYVFPRPQFASHIDTIEALTKERINWLGYNVRYMDGHSPRVRTGLTFEEACKVQARMVKDGHTRVVLERTVVSAGWPQLPYEELVKLPPNVLPPVSRSEEDHEAFLHELMKIRDKGLRKAAIRMRKEMYESMMTEIEATIGETE